MSFKLQNYGIYMKKSFFLRIIYSKSKLYQSKKRYLHYKSKKNKG